MNDLFSLQGLRNLGPTLIDWRAEWDERRGRNPEPNLDLPRGSMQPIGYVLMQAGMRLSRPVKSYERWVQRIPPTFHEFMLGDLQTPLSADLDPASLGIMRHYQSLMPLAQDARLPMFDLKPADGAIGAHMEAVRRCSDDFEALAKAILSRMSASEVP